MLKFFRPAFFFLALAVTLAVGVQFIPRVAGANEPRTQLFSKTVDVASLVDGAGATNTVTAPGASLGDFCTVSMGVDLQGLLATCYISAANVISVRIQNETTGTLDLASTTQRVRLIKSGQF